jgi:16S rRNA (cytosine967-C5)-methyltransferase
LPDKKTDPDKFLSIKYSFPLWLSKKWVHAFGFEKAESLCQQINTIPSITICCNRLKTNRRSLSEQLQADAKNVQITDYASQGLSFSNPVLPVQ